MTALPQDAVADLQQRIAELERQLETAVNERDAAIDRQTASALVNFRLKNELRAATDRQNASAEVLRAIANTSGDADRSLVRITEITARLFGAPSATLSIVDGDRWGRTIRVGASSKHIGTEVSEAQRRIGGRNLPGTVVQENRQIHIPDLDHVDASMAEWPGLPPARASGTRVMSGTPLRRDGKAIGVLIVYRDRPVPFTDEELELQQNFADQAVIAIENARLFNETQEALERQTATADILKVIASSPSDVQPVFDAIAESAKRLMAGYSAAVFRFVDGMTYLEAFTPTTPVADEVLKSTFPMPVVDFPLAERNVLNGATTQIPDTENGLEFQTRLARARGFRSIMFTPLMHRETAIGMITITRREPGPFADHHVQLLRTFADQAVIAIENTRLFNETQEALERQTATADILKVIAGSPSDVQPVFEAIVRSAAKLFEPCAATITTVKDGKLHWNATEALLPGYDVEGTKTIYPIAFDPERSPSARAVLERRIIEIPDTDAPDTPEYTRKAAAAGGFRAITYVPLIDQDQGLGTIIFAHPQAGFKFSDKQLALVQTFADQAVIAIQNTRLFNETKEALERQTATADILKVIASSPSDTTPVFEAIADSAKRLLGGLSAAVFRIIGGTVHLAAFTSINPAADAALNADFPRPVDGFEGFQLARAGKPFVIPDTEERTSGTIRGVARLHGFRSMLYVPLMNGDVPFGIITVTRAEPGGFPLHHIQLLQTFADQAVIAIENARLFNEVQERTRDLSESLQQQTATSEVLQIISSSPGDLVPVFDKMLENATRVCGAEFGAMNLVEGDTMRRAALYNAPPAFAATLSSKTFPIHPKSSIAGAVSSKQVVQVEDIRESPSYLARAQHAVELAELGGARTLVVVPMLRDDEAIGVITVYRQEVRPFSGKQIDLLTNFARQAVIAIENARLLRELRQRTDDLAESLQQQTATSEVLQIISSSPGDLTPVFAKMLENATRVCGAQFGSMLLVEDQSVRQAALFNAPQALAAVRVNRVFRPHPQSALAAAIRTRQVCQVEDLRTQPAYLERNPATVEFVELGGVRTAAWVPMVRENDTIGVITIYRQEVQPFDDKQIELVRNFAKQAVIAIENARLLRELRQRTDDLAESLQQQTATSEVLQVISSSPGDLVPVFDKMLENATRVCGAEFGSMNLIEDGNTMRRAALYNAPPAFAAALTGKVLQIHPRSGMAAAIRSRQVVQVQDVRDSAAYRERSPMSVELVELGGARTVVAVPMLREEDVIGVIIVYRQEVRPFSEKQIDLLTNFARQAVIAIENARLLRELRQRTDDLTEALQQQIATSEVLQVISSKPGELGPVFQSVLENATRICGANFGALNLFDGEAFEAVALFNTPQEFRAARLNTRFRPHPESGHGKIIASKEVVQIEDLRESRAYRDGSPNVVLIADIGGARSMIIVPMLKEAELIGTIAIYRQEVRPFSDKQIALLSNFANQAVIAIENARLLKELRQRTDDLTRSLDDLRTAQDRLIQTEKLASLGQLTAGIAHEIKNPLNFVNNFAALSAELTDELKDVLKPAMLDETIRAEVDEVTGLLKDNLGKVVQHGKRADSIVKNMLLHSREGSGEHRPADINALVDESLNLAYHGARAEKPQFNVTLRRDFDPQAGMVEVFPQEITRVLLNLISNGFYAVARRKADNGGSEFEPMVTATTRGRDDHVEIRIRDNGTGIPPEVKEKMFNPFFTTKPAGEGTGLGLSMSHDIIVKQHGGTIEVETEPGAFTEFRLVLPRTSLARANGNR